MKNYISINQKNFIEIAKQKNIKIDAIDGILFDWIQNFTKSNKALKKLIENKLYIWVSYAAIREDNPLCNINSNDVVGRRLNKLVDLGLLEKYLSKEDGNKVFFHITDFAFTYLLESSELPTQKSEPLPTQKSDNSKLDNSKLDSKKIYTKKDENENSKNIPKDLITFYKENISNLQSKIKEVSSTNAMALCPDSLEEILIGLKNYANDLPKDKFHITNLEKFIKEKFYLDYQEVVRKNAPANPLSISGKKYTQSEEF